MSAHGLPMPKPTDHIQREVRRVRHLTAWLVFEGDADRECRVMDISKNGAKLMVVMPPEVPSRFDLAFGKGDEKRRACEVIWRRGKILGVKFR